MNPRLAELIAETLDIPVASVTPELTRDEHPAWDSLNHLRLATSTRRGRPVAQLPKSVDCELTSARSRS